MRIGLPNDAVSWHVFHAVSEPSWDVCGDKSIMRTPTHFRVEIARRKGARDAIFRGRWVAYANRYCKYLHLSPPRLPSEWWAEGATPLSG
jgi:hypothetical protein